MKTLLALILLASVAAAAPPSMTGKFWKVAGPEQKSAYLVGFREGLLSGDTPEEKLAGLFPKGPLSLAGLIAEIDRFYASSENLKLPVALALIVVTEKVGGKMTPAQIDNWLALMRPDFTEDGELLKKK